MEWISDISNQISGSSWVPQVSVLYLGLGFSFPLPTPSPVEPLLECGSLLPLLRGEHRRLNDRLGGGAGIAKAAASRRTPTCPRTPRGPVFPGPSPDSLSVRLLLYLELKTDD